MFANLNTHINASIMGHRLYTGHFYKFYSSGTIFTSFNSKHVSRIEQVEFGWIVMKSALY